MNHMGHRVQLAIYSATMNLLSSMFYYRKRKCPEEKLLSSLAASIVSSLAAAVIATNSSGKDGDKLAFYPVSNNALHSEAYKKISSQLGGEFVQMYESGRLVKSKAIEQLRETIVAFRPLPERTFLYTETPKSLNGNAYYNVHPEARLSVMAVQIADTLQFMHINVLRFGLHLPRAEQCRRLPLYYTGWHEARRYIETVVEVLEAIGIELDMELVRKTYCYYAAKARRYFDYVEDGGDCMKKIDSQQTFEDAFADLPYALLAYVEARFEKSLRRSERYRRLIVKQLKDRGCGDWQSYVELAKYGKLSPEEFDESYAKNRVRICRLLGM